MATPANQLQSLQSANSAPLDPLLRLKDGARLPNNKITDALKDKFRTKWNENNKAWESLVNIGVQVELFFQGQQFPFRNPLDGSWSVLPLTGVQNSNTQKAALNIMHNYYANLESKWLGSNPDILVRPGRNIDQCAIAAKGGQVVWDFYNRRYYDVWYSRQECRAGTTFGTYLNRVRYDDSVQSMSILQDVFETKNVSMGDGLGYCPSCNFMGPASQFQQNPEGVENFGGSVGTCPECQNPQAFLEQPPSGDFPSVSGQEEISRGELVCEQLPLASVRFDLMKRAEDSSWFIYRQETTKGALQRVLGNVKIPGESGNQDSNLLDGLSTVRALAFSSQALGGYGNLSEISKYMKDKVSFDEMWLSADDIADINLSGDEKTVSGDTLPEGKLSDIFPNGLCAVGLNGMAVILGLYGEQHKQHISSGVWYLRGLSGAGRGLADSIEVQKQINRFANQQALYHDTLATPAVGVDKQIMPTGRAKYLGTPNMNIPFDLTKLPDGRTMKDALWQFQAAPFPAAAIQYYQQFLNMVGQKTSGVTDFNQGEPGITASNTTATAAEIDQSNADVLNQPIFQGKADVRKRNAEITLRLYPKFFPMKRFLHIAGKFGAQQGIELYGTDLEADLVCEVVTNSEMPKGPFTQRKNLMSLFQITQGGQGYSMLKASDPKLAANLVQTFDVDLAEDSFDDVADLCRKRLDMMKKASDAGVTDPTVLISAIQPPISQAEPHLKEKAQWFSEQLDVDELQEAPMPLRNAVELLAEGQIAGFVQQSAMLATAEGAIQAAGAAPEALGQQELDQANQQPEPEAQIDPNAELKMKADAQGRAEQSAESEKQRKHEASEGDKERANKLALAKLKPNPKAPTSHK